MTTNYNHNGRVDIITPDINIKFNMMDKNLIDDCVSFRESINVMFDNTPLINAYFSQKNIQIIQNAIRANVYKHSNGQHIIGNQDYDTLKIIMRGVFLQHSMNMEYNYTKQIIQLNELVVDYAVKQILGEIDSYIKYKRDASTLVVPLAHPVMTSTLKTKQLELKKWF
jgi:hypothetical protein